MTVAADPAQAVGLDELQAEFEQDAAAGQATVAPAPADGFEPYCASLEEWVATVFAPTYARRATPTFSWCAQWWRHPEAIVRLEALWRSWETLRLDPLLGMSVWLTGHLDPQVPILTGPAGPFAGCDPTMHFPPDPPQLAHTPAPDGWWPSSPD